MDQLIRRYTLRVDEIGRGLVDRIQGIVEKCTVGEVKPVEIESVDKIVGMVKDLYLKMRKEGYDPETALGKASTRVYVDLIKEAYEKGSTDELASFQFGLIFYRKEILEKLMELEKPAEQPQGQGQGSYAFPFMS